MLNGTAITLTKGTMPVYDFEIEMDIDCQGPYGNDEGRLSITLMAGKSDWPGKVCAGGLQHFLPLFIITL